MRSTGWRALSAALVMVLGSTTLAVGPPPAAAQAPAPTAGSASSTGPSSQDQPAPPASASPPRRPDPAPDATATRSAPPFDLARAKLIERTRTGNVYENPDGTRTLRTFAGPANWRDSAGRWQPIDPTVVADGERGFKNRSGEVTFAFAKRADSPSLVRASAKGWSVSFGFEGARGDAAPVVEGHKIRYPQVGEGIHLDYTVGVDQLKEVVVLERPLAAAASSTFRFPLAASGVTPSTDDDGTIVFVDPDGTKVAVIPPGSMQDASGDEATGAEPAAAPVTTRLVRDAGRWVVELAPDRAWLDDPARQYPISIDPSFWAGANNGGTNTYGTDAFVGSGCGNCNYNGGNQLDTDGNYVNKIGYSWYNGGSWEWRTYAYYDVSPANNQDILRADWYGHFYSVSHTNSSFVMRPAAGGWDEWGINWSNQPLGCCAEIFGSTSGETVMRDMRTWVHNWTHGGWGNGGIEMDNYGQGQYLRMGAHESYYQRSFIDVTYNTLANTPSSPSPAYQWWNSTTPTLCADYSDPNLDQGYLRFDIYDSAGTYKGVITSTPWAASGTRPCATVPAGWVGEGYMWYHAFAFDGYNWSTGYADVWLRIDTTPPPPPGLSSSTHGDSNVWYAGRSFAASWPAPADASGISGYAVSAPTTSASAEAGFAVTRATSDYSATVSGDGQWYLNVRAKDGAGNWGANARFAFKVDATGPAAPAVTADAPHVCNSTTWAADDTPSFTWSVSDISGINGYSYDLNQLESFTLDDSVDTTTANHTSVVRADGTWWFHVKARNGANVWGDTARCKVLIDAGSPAAPVARSTSHRDAATWYSNRTTAFAWEPGAGTSPVVAYAHDAPDRLTERDPAPDSDGAGETASYTVGGDGTWYFHVRAQNAAEAWGPSANVKVNVDVTAPEPPAAVLSATHPAGVAVSNDRATVTWTPGSDATSGVAGYSWTFNQDQAAEDNGTKDGDALTLSATSGSLPEGVSWFHVKTIDNAGNASADKVYGPIVVDPGGPLGLSPTLPSVAEAASDELGLEHFYPYARHDLGTATGYVHLRTGNVVVQQEDVSIPGQGLNVVVRRTYNAQDPRDLDGLGAGWRLSVTDLEAGLEGVEGAVESLDAGAGLTAANLVSDVGTVVGRVLEFVDGDGTTHRFVRQGGPGSRWDAPPGVSIRVFEDTDGAGVVTAYRLVRPDGVTYRAENLKALPSLTSLPTATWRVTSVTDRNANRLTYGYDPVTVATVVKPRLVRIKHSGTGDAEVVRFSYNPEGLLSAVTSLPGYSAPDPASGTTPSWERHTALGYASGRLTSVTEADHATTADGKRTTGFSYDATTGLLDGVTDALVNTTRLAYSPDAGAQRLTTLTDRRAKPWRYAYGPADAAGARTTTATSPLGTKTTYDISGRTAVSDSDRRVAGGNIAKITDAGADTAGVVDGFSWLQNRLVAVSEGASADATAATTSYAYNDLGLLTTVTEPAPNRAGTPGLPAGAATSPVASTLAYRFAAPWRIPGCTAPEPGSEPVTKEGFCEAVADLAQVRAADNYGDGVRRVSDFAYGDDTGRLTAVHQRANGSGAPAGADRTTSFAYYDRGGLRSIDGPRADVSDVTTFGDPTKPVDGGYDRTGMPTRLTDAVGKTKTWAYTPYGKIAKLVDRDGAETTTVYDHRDNAVRVSDPAGHVTAYGYDANDQKTTETSPRGMATADIGGDFTTAWAYDANGWVTQASGPGKNATAPRVVTTTAWNDDGTKTSDTSAIGGVTTYAYWPNRALKATTTPAGAGASAVSEYFYDLAGRVRLERAPVTNAAGDRPESETTYAPDGGVVASTETSPVAGQKAVTRSAYNAHGEVIETRGPRSEGGVEAATTSSYNTFGEAVASRRRLSAKSLDTFYGYDAAGNQTCQVQPTGSGGGTEAACNGSATPGQLVSLYRYDALGQLVEQTTDPVNPGHTVAYEYSGEGQQTARRDLVNGDRVRTTTYAYNRDNTRQSMVVTDHASAKTLATCNWAEGAAPTSGYDEDGNLAATRTVEGTAGCGAGTLLRSQSFTWDDRGWLVATTQKVRSPQSGAMVSRDQRFAHNPDGTPSSATHVVPVVDGTGAKTTEATTTYEKYSPGGRLEALTDWRGRVSTFSTFASGTPATTCVGRTGTTGCAGGVAKAAFSYLGDGSPSELVWTALASTGAERRVRSHTDIAYDLAGLRTAETVQVEQPGGTTAGGRGGFSYDLAERLTAWTSPFPEAGTTTAPATTYGLDDGGNIAVEEVRLGTTLRSRAESAYSAGRLSSRRTETYGAASGTVIDTDGFSYDGLGQEKLRTTAHQEGALPATESARRATTYNPAGHTTRADDQRVATDAVDVDYAYDTTDRLVARTETSATAAERTLYFYWGTSGNLAEETDAAGATKVLYLVDDDHEALGQESVTRPLTGGEVRAWSWLLADASGNVATHVDDSGAVVQQSAYDPYGKDDKAGSAKKAGATAPNSTLGFQSAMTDKVTGAVVLGPRQYDPTTSRFTTPDVFVASALDVELGADELTGNRYLFAAANPVAYYEDGHGIGMPKIKLPSPLKAAKQLAKKALPFVPVVGAGIEAVSIATGRDWLEGGRKMSGSERLVRTGLLAGGAVVGVGVAKVAAKVVQKTAAKAKTVAPRSALSHACSFSGVTVVLMADGTTKAMADIEVGDMVLAEDPETGERGARQVTKLWIHRDQIADLELEDGSSVATTEDHPFWNATDAEWQRADALDPGDLLLSADGDLLAVGGMVAASTRTTTAYNLTVDDIHTYFVVVGDEPVLVHNNNTCELPAALTVGRNADEGVHVYQGVFEGKPVYTGITNNVGRRTREHVHPFEGLEAITSGAGLTRGQARAVEQAIMARNPHYWNLRNSISPRHGYYNQAVRWGEQWLRSNRGL